MRSVMADPVSVEMVKWAYRLVLGREAESDEVVVDQAMHHENLQSLRTSFLTSEEFFRVSLAQLRFSLSGDEPPMEAEVEASPEMLARLLAHVDRAWEQLGEQQPFWSVLSSDDFLSERMTEDRVAQFYESGVREYARFNAALARAGVSVGGKTTCLEYGCGLGRMTQQLARNFERVVAVDISAAHLAVAAQRAGAAGFNNIEWTHLHSISDIDLLPQVDVIYSMIVLQHNPPPVIDAIIKMFARILNKGGCAYFQVPTYRRGYRFDVRNYLSSNEDSQDIEMHVYPQERIFQAFADAGAVPLSVVEDGWTGQPGERSNTFLFRKT